MLNWLKICSSTFLQVIWKKMWNHINERQVTDVCMREVNVAVEMRLTPFGITRCKQKHLLVCARSHSWDRGPCFQDLHGYLEGAALSQAASGSEPSAGEILWQVLMCPENSLKGDSCRREQGVQVFLLLWLSWKILSSLAGMVSADEKNFQHRV